MDFIFSLVLSRFWHTLMYRTAFFSPFSGIALFCQHDQHQATNMHITTSIVDDQSIIYLVSLLHFDSIAYKYTALQEHPTLSLQFCFDDLFFIWFNLWLNLLNQFMLKMICQCNVNIYLSQTSTYGLHPQNAPYWWLVLLDTTRIQYNQNRKSPMPYDSHHF